MKDRKYPGLDVVFGLKRTSNLSKESSSPPAPYEKLPATSNLRRIAPECRRQLFDLSCSMFGDVSDVKKIADRIEAAYMDDMRTMPEQEAQLTEAYNYLKLFVDRALEHCSDEDD